MKKYLTDYIEKDHQFDKVTFVGILFLIVVITGIFGWIYEFIFYYFNGGMEKFYWRGGNFLPWINIYAIGSCIIYFLTYKFRKKPYLIFLISFISTGILEYVSGYGYFYITGNRCWDYNQEILNFLNINGFVCLRSVLFFGLSSLLLMYMVVPICFFLAQKMNKKMFIIISSVLFFTIIFDELYNLLFARLLDLPRASDIYKQLGFHYVQFK